ncbi:hypothetical protein BD410DRAFT_780579 [Rickenella mellea]|uniref:Thioesterase domain-containing protein n=1 Tax=Rickenella mellea TaxID=50990 RepID=A0A4R5XIB2_9AGAM|nr:hypothetical protein BD410DRAFT_797489 [Rickenella mellea]TDL30057.1 hypothetical protein BD410DRAFT_780579 [Rickenella mellea]
MSTTPRKALPTSYPSKLTHKRVRPENVASIGGNVPDDMKEHVASMFHIFMGRGAAFADSVGERVKITSIDIIPKVDEPEKLESRVVCEIDVSEDMVNGGGNMHGACSVYLIDVCSSLPICALDLAQGGSGSAGVSQAINTIFHSPAIIGDTVRIISSTLSIGARTTSSRCEIWNVTQHRLVASGVHVKMEPTPSSGRSKL